jgi:YesN/AraC family two-component response regulator
MYGYIVEGLYTPDSSIDQDVRVALSELYDMVISLFNDATLLGSFYNTGFKLITDRDCAEVAIKNEIENVLLKYSKIYDVPIGIAISSRFKYPDNVVALHKNVQMQLMNRPFKFVNTVTTAENFHQPYCKLVTKTMSIIAREYTGNISIPRIAERLLISPSHLMHVFKENVGRTVNDYITEFRLLKAKHILKHEPYRNIGDVAQMVGYSDEKYFGQVFKKHTGMTPGEFSLK